MGKEAEFSRKSHLMPMEKVVPVPSASTDGDGRRTGPITWGLCKSQVKLVTMQQQYAISTVNLIGDQSLRRVLALVMHEQ